MAAKSKATRTTHSSVIARQTRSFMAVASFTLFALMILTAYPWGVMHTDAGHLIANEKLLGDFVGVVIALITIAVLVRLKKAQPA